MLNSAAQAEAKLKKSSVSDWLIPSVAALAGAVAALVATLLTTGHLEAKKLTQQRQSEAVASYLQAAWGSASEQDEIDFLRKLSLLSAYAPPGVLESVRAYGGSGCAETGDEEEHCRQLWVAVVAELRSLVGSEPVPENLIRGVLWAE